MKKLKRLPMLALLACLTACTGNYEYPTFGPLPEGEKYNIGILLPVEHDALNKTAEGFIAGLEEAGWKDGVNLSILKRNANGSSDDQRTMAKSIINDCDLALGLGTGAATDLKSAQKNKGSKKPILFSAVTDPVSAKLVDSLEQPGGYVTGTSDAQPVDAQIELIKECIPTVDKIGIFYTLSESNSDIQAKQAAAAIQAIGATSVIKTCTGPTDVSTSVSSLVNESGLDAIYIPTDNNIAANMNYIASAVKGKHILVVVGEEGMLVNGGHISLSIDYTNLGKIAGQMAVEILNGTKKPEEIPVKTMSKDECKYVMSSEYLEEAGVEIPSEVADKCEDVSK